MVVETRMGLAECGRELVAARDNVRFFLLVLYAFPFCFIHILDTIELDSGYGLRRLLCAIAVFFRSVAVCRKEVIDHLGVFLHVVEDSRIEEV